MRKGGEIDERGKAVHRPKGSRCRAAGHGHGRPDLPFRGRTIGKTPRPGKRARRMALCGRRRGYCAVPARFFTDLPEMMVPALGSESSAEALSVSRTTTLAVAPVESITVTRANPG